MANFTNKHKIPRSNKRLTTEEWVSKCKEVHGDTFLYDKSIYKNSSTSIIITCRVHGDISVNPTRHKTGSGCMKCKRAERAKTQRGKLEDYLAIFKKVHGDNYDYSKLKQFKRNTDKGEFICRKHGVFYQEFRRHAEGVGCEKCSYEKRGKGRMITYEHLLIKSKEKFGNKFTYCKDSYEKDSINLLVTCPSHGQYIQNRNSHFNSSTGCNKCSNKILKHTTESFIEGAKKVHKNFYDYSKTIYGENNTDKVVITCKHHGDFLQRPMGHLGGAGCPTCANIKSNIFYNGTTDFIDVSKSIEAHLYLLVFDNFCKVGITTRLKSRFSKLSKIFGIIKCKFVLKDSLFNAATQERQLLEKFDKYNCKDLFPHNVQGRTECFKIDALEELKKYFHTQPKGEH